VPEQSSVQQRESITEGSVCEKLVVENRDRWCGNGDIGLEWSSCHIAKVRLCGKRDDEMGAALIMLDNTSSICAYWSHKEKGYLFT